MHDGIDGERADAFHAELIHDVPTMRDDGRKADIQLVCNLFVDVALNNQGHHLDFPVGENLLAEDSRHRRHVLTMTMRMLLQGPGCYAREQTRAH